jgi:hypothetical protein
MNSIKQILGDRCKLLRFAPFVAALTAFFLLGVNVPAAGANAPGKDTPKNSHEYYSIRDPKVDSKLSADKRARVQRDTVFKKRQELRKNIQDLMAGKPASGGGDK